MKTILQMTPPACEPLYIDEVKKHLRVDTTDDDALIASLLTAARTHVENYTGRTLVAQGWRLWLDNFPLVIEVPCPPLIQVTSITYLDTAGATQTVTSTVYEVFKDPDAPWVEEAKSQVWPSGNETRENAIQVNYNAGYAAKVTANATSNVLTVYGRTLADGDAVRLTNSGGALPAGLSTGTDYYVRDYTAATFKLAATVGGTAIDITDAGTGLNFIGEVPAPIIAALKMLVGHWYEHREAIIDSPSPMELPMAVESLLWPYRVWQ